MKLQARIWFGRVQTNDGPEFGFRVEDVRSGIVLVDGRMKPEQAFNALYQAPDIGEVEVFPETAKNWGKQLVAKKVKVKLPKERAEHPSEDAEKAADLAEKENPGWEAGSYERMWNGHRCEYDSKTGERTYSITLHQFVEAK